MTHPLGTDSLLGDQLEVQGRCAFGDPLCPCQDGDACHYTGTNPATPPTAEELAGYHALADQVRAALRKDER